jgi:general secretion pathway protein K
MRYTPANKNQSGSATLLTIFLSAIIITIGIGFNWLVKENLKSAEGLKLKSEAMLNAHSTFDTLMYLILTGKKTQKEYVLQNAEEFFTVTNIPLNGEYISAQNTLQISIRDTNGMISLTSLNESALKRLIRMFSGEDATGIIDSYLDWIDRDRFVRLNGAEEFYYNSERLPYTPRNYPIQYKEEFALIKGMNKELYKKIEPYITILPSLGFNPNTASEAVLMAYLDIDRDAVKSIKDYMLQKQILSDMELFSLTGRRIVHDEGVYFYPSPFLEITIKAGIPEPIYTIHAGIDTRWGMNFPYRIMFYKEE